MTSIRRVGLLYDDRDRPETTGGYCFRALRDSCEVVHLRPSQLDGTRAAEFDLFVRVDDGLEYPVPSHLRPLAWWAIDTHLDLDRCLRQAQSADLTFVAQKPATEAFRRAGIPSVEWLPLACDPTVHRPHGLTKKWDFCFVGNLFPGPRSELLERLARQYPRHFVGRAYFEEMARVYSESRTVFNRSIRDDLNMRVFETLACGSLLLTNSLPLASGQGELFQSESHLITYRDGEELIDRLRFCLEQPEYRSRIEQAGLAEVVARHTYRHRTDQILTAATRLSRPVSVAATAQGVPTRMEVDPGYFEFDRPELLALVPHTARDVVDVGCGAGRLGESLKSRQPCRVVGIEQNPAAANAARTRLDLVIEGDAENLTWPFSDQSFDAVLCGDVLEHLRDPLSFLRRVRDWLRPNGVVVVSLPNVRHHSVIRGLLSGDWTYESAGLLDHTHLRFFTRREAEKLFFRAGFETPRFQSIPGPGFEEWQAAGQPGEVTVGGLRIAPLEPREALEFYTYQWLAAVRVASRSDPGLTSIVILTHNQLAFTRHCLDSIRLLTDEPYELILVDNASTDGTVGFLETLAATDPRIRVICNRENRGFPAGCNQGITIARGQQILLLNNDTVVTSGWLTRLLRALHSNPTIGLVGPCSNRVSGEQQVPVAYPEHTLDGLDGFAWEWAKSHEGIRETTDRLIGFCLLIRRSVVDTLGGLDEQYGMGNFEDDDYCLRALQAGFQAVIARDAFVHHVGGATFRAVGVDYAELLQRNRERFHARWKDVLNPAAQAPVATAISPLSEIAQEPKSGEWSLRIAEGGGLLLERHRLLVSGCLIVRDNAKTIRPCLESLKPWVDELIVVDTGSQDATPKIAEEMGARVFHFPWVDDFSAARNESVRHARGEWVFWMDSDDTIDEKNGRGLRDLAQGTHVPNVLGYVMGVHCPGPRGGDDLTIVDHLKLFRNRPELRFEHRIHEQIIPAIRRAGGEVAWTDLFVVHSGYDHSPEGQVRKKERDLRILHRELSEWPDHPFTLFNLGMTYADVGQPTEAIEYFRRSLAHSAAGDSQRRKAYALMAHCHLALGDVDEALGVCQAGLVECPEDRELQFRLGVVCHHAGRLSESVAAYERVLSIGRERYFSSMDPGIAGFKARGNMALVLADLGEWDRAEAAWREVTREAPGYGIGWRHLGDLLVKRGKVAEAAALAHTLLANPQLVAEGHLLNGRVELACGQQTEAAQAWGRAATANPTDPEPLQLLGRLHFESRADAAAEDVLHRLARIAPSDAATYHNLGTLQLRGHRPAEAAAAFRKSLELRPRSLSTHVCLGYALQSLGDREGAANAWREVLKSDPSHHEATEALRLLGQSAG